MVSRVLCHVGYELANGGLKDWRRSSLGTANEYTVDSLVLSWVPALQFVGLLITVQYFVGLCCRQHKLT